MYRWQMTCEYALFQDDSGQLGDEGGGMVGFKYFLMFGWDLRPLQDNSSQLEQ